MSCSLDGYIEDSEGKFDFGFPTEEIHAFVNHRLRSIDTFVFGRRMYETMRVWETMDDPEPVMQEFAELW
jgi:dihydrofolate reductase